MKLLYLPDKERIQIIEATNVELRSIKSTFDRYVDGYMFDPRFKMKLWNGKNTCFNKEDNTFPMGMWKEAFKCCQECGFNFDFVNKDQFPINRYIKKKEFYQFVEDFFKGYIYKGQQFKPRDYQVRVAYNILKNRYCNIAVATSGGKTFIYSLVMFYLLSKHPDKKFLLVVPSKTLVTQFFDDVNNFNWNNQLDINAQEIFGEEENPRTVDPTREPNFVIATFQSLTHETKIPDPKAKNKTKTRTVLKFEKSWFKQFWSVVGDEFHKGRSDSYSKKIFKYTFNNAYYRWGMSGSYPDESSNEMAEIMKSTGPIVDVVKARDLMDQGFITQVKIKGVLMHHNDWEFSEQLESISSRDKKAAYDVECLKIQESEERLSVVNQIVSKCKANTLVLFHNQEYGEKLLQYLQQRNPDKTFHFINGKISNKKRTPIKEMMEQTKVDVEYTILNFGDYEIEIKSNTDIMLSDGSYKKAGDITSDDDIDDDFIEKIKNK